MNENVDVYVCNPDVGINKQLKAVFIQFEVMDAGTQQGTGKSHTVLMPTRDAMQLLVTLHHIQNRFGLPLDATGAPIGTEISWDDPKN
jgi:hypothetical protein